MPVNPTASFAKAAVKTRAGPRIKKSVRIAAEKVALDRTPAALSTRASMNMKIGIRKAITEELPLL